MSIPTLTVSPAAAASAYAKIDAGGEPSTDTGFAAVLQNAVGSAIQAGHAADTQSIGAITGKGNLTDVVAAISHADLALQTAVAIRDRVVSAYQEVMRMAI